MARWTAEEESALKERYLAGDTFGEIAEALGKTKGAINAKVLQLQEKGELPKRGVVKRRRSETWNDETNARLLTLLDADGYLPTDAAQWDESADL